MAPTAVLERLQERPADGLLAFFARRTFDPQIAADLFAIVGAGPELGGSDDLPRSGTRVPGGGLSGSR